jgi:4-amino-4-deoxy-L-arabinose transferase-like glycosyltransferase
VTPSGAAVYYPPLHRLERRSALGSGADKPQDDDLRFLNPLAALLIVASLTLAFLGARGLDPTSDERLYFGIGRSLLLTGRWQGFAPQLHPPLSYYVNSLPLLLLPAESRPSYWDPRLLLMSRTTSLVLFGLPLLVAVFCWARDRHGPQAALVALALAGFSPTLVAHAGLITADLAAASTGCVALYLFWRAERRGRGSLGWGLALGIALLAKGSAWLIVAAIVALAAFRGVARDPAGRLRRTTLGLLVALLVLNVGYGFDGLLDLEGKRALLGKVPEAAPARVAAWVAAPFFPLPYLKSMATQLHVGVQGWPSFLMGEVSRTGWRHYFLVALSVKETVPFLLLVISALALAWRRDGWRDDVALVGPAALIVLAFSLGRVQIGVRYLLPALPLLAVFASGLYPRAGRVGRAALIGLTAWHVGAALRAYPHYIPYFNEVAGGSLNGYRYLGDSNLDWGQNRTEAAVFARDHRLPLDPQPLPSAGGVVVSATRLQGIFDRETYRILREEYDPVGHVGYAYLVYDLGRKRRNASPR